MLFGFFFSKIRLTSMNNPADR